MIEVQVATMDANCGGVSRAGVIDREGSRYVIAVDGRRSSGGWSLESAAHRLAAALRQALPPQRDGNWGVVVRCVLRPDVSLVFGGVQVICEHASLMHDFRDCLLDSYSG